MPETVKVRQPEYYAKFRCIGSDCEDTCCSGSGVVVDKTTYEKYRVCPDPDLKPLLDEKIRRNTESDSDQTYALVVLNGSSCPFLSEKRLCKIQLKLGEDYLSRTCHTYPRAMSQVDSVSERSLYLSCPEAARLVLLNPDGLGIVELETEESSRFGGFPELDTTDSLFAGKPYGQFQPVRQFVLSLLQNRDYVVWKRLIILGLFCDELNKLSGEGIAGAVEGLISSFTETIKAQLFEETLQNIPLQPGLQVAFLIKSLEYRVSSDFTGQRFLDCYKQFLEGIQYKPGATPEELGGYYSEAYRQYYAPFMAEHEYIF